MAVRPYYDKILGRLREKDPGTIDGSGSAGRIPKFVDADTITTSVLIEDANGILIDNTKFFSSANGNVRQDFGSGNYYRVTDDAGAAAAGYINIGSNTAEFSYRTNTGVVTISAGSSSKAEIVIDRAAQSIAIAATGATNVGIGVSSPSAKLHIVQAISTTGSPTGLLFTGGAHTTLTAGAEATDVNYNLNRTVQFATGAITTQRAFLIQAPTYAFVGASTITSAGTFVVSGAPVAGTNATITNSYALWVQSGTSLLQGGTIITPAVGTGSPQRALTVNAAAHTALTAGTEHSSFFYNGGVTQQFATGAITTQRFIRIDAPTYAFVGASTITTAATLSVSGAPVAGTNATITNPLAFWVQTGASNFGGFVGIGNSLPTSELDIARNANDDLLVAIQNSSAGTAARGLYRIQNDASINYSTILTSSGFTTAGIIVANQARINYNGAASLLFSLNNSAATYKWAIGGTAAGNEYMRLSTAGLGINVSGAAMTAPVSALEVNGAGAGSNIDGIRMRTPGVATGMTSIVATDCYGLVTYASATTGGMQLFGLSDTDATAVLLRGAVGTTTPTVAAINIRGEKKNGTTVQALAATEILAVFTNLGTVVQTTLANGFTFIGGTTTPAAVLHLAAGTTSTNTAPLKFTSGSLNTSASAGSVEFLTDDFYLTITTGTARHKIGRVLTGSATLDFPNTAAGAASDLTITVTGAADGDCVVVGVPNGSMSADNISFWGWVSAADTVTVRFNNNNLVAAVNPASGTFKVTVIKN